MRAKVIVAALAALAVGGGLLVHGLGFMAGFNTTPLADLVAIAAAHEESPSRRATPPTDNRVIVVVVDGMRVDYAGELGLESGGRARASCSLAAHLPTFSRPNYVALSTGVPPWASGVRTNDHEGRVALPSIWEVARRAGYTSHLVADGTDWWVELFPSAFTSAQVIPEERFDAFWAGYTPAPEPGVTLIHLVAADDAAHDHGTGGAYRIALAAAGRRIRRLLDDLDPSRDTLIVTADHGHIERGGHGGPEEEVATIPLLAFGAGVEPRLVEGLSSWCGSLIDLPGSIAARLDIAPPVTDLGGSLPVIRPHRAAYTASPPGRSLDLPEPDERQRPLSLRAAIAGLGLWLALVLLVLPLFVVAARRAILVSALTAPVVFAVTYALFEPTLSLSAVWLENPWKVRLAVMAAITALVSARVVFARHDPAEALLILACGAALPFSVAGLAHGSFAAGPVLGDPHAAFSLIVADLFGAVSSMIAVVAALVAFIRERRRARAKVWVD